MRIFTTHNINKLAIFCLIVYGTILSFVYIQKLDPSLSVLIQEHEVSNIKNTDMFSGVIVSKEFTPKYNNLGIVAIRFNTFKSSINDTLIFRIKEKNDPVWYYTASYKTDQFQDHQIFPFGFPIIEDSKGMLFQVELESMSGSESGHVRIDNLLPIFTSKYQYKIQNLHSFSSIYKFIQLKIFNIANYSSLPYSMTLYFLPLIFFVILNRSTSIFSKKVKLYSISMPLLFLISYNFTSLPKPAYWEATIILIWSIYLLKNKLTPKTNLIVAMATIPYIVYELIGDNVLQADVGAYWLFSFLFFAVVHDIIVKITHVNKNK